MERATHFPIFINSTVVFVGQKISERSLQQVLFNKVTLLKFPDDFVETRFFKSKYGNLFIFTFTSMESLTRFS